MTLDALKKSLEKVNFVAIGTDTSNRGNIKMLPIVVRYFSSTEGIQNKMIDLFELGQETGKAVFGKVKSIVESYGLRSKFVVFAGDNCNTNFGGVNRNGTDNIFSRLGNEYSDHELVGVGCCAHLFHKAIEKACHVFQSFFDVEAVVVKIFGYFNHITVRDTRLQQLFSEDGSNEIKLLGYSNTRFIGFKGCISRIIENFDLLKTFFENEKDAPLLILKFFDHQLSKILLVFVRDQCQLFESAIKSVEGDRTSGYEAAKAIHQLLDRIEARKEEQFCSIDFERELDKIEPLLPFSDTILVKQGNSVKNVTVLVDEPYLKNIFNQFYGSNFLIEFLCVVLFISTFTC